MQGAVCPLCHSQETEKRFSVRGHDLLLCNNCELLFIHPYTATNSAATNAQSHVHHNEATGIKSLEKDYSASIQFYARYFPLIDQECQDAKSVLDIGCGTGRLLELLGRRGDLYRVGVEIDPHRAQFARRIANCEIWEIPFERFSSNMKYDVIIAINVFSHIPIDELISKLSR